jgi:hypothetical protein
VGESGGLKKGFCRFCNFYDENGINGFSVMPIFVLMRGSFCAIFFILCSQIIAQPSPRNSLGVGISRYGVSASFRHDNFFHTLASRSINHTGFYLDVGNIQHPREVAVVNTVFQNSSTYKVDKTNFAWTVRPGLLYSLMLSERADRRAIGVNLTSGPGITLAYTWPVYVTILQVDPAGNEYFTDVRYNPDIHKTSEIAGRAGFSRGFSQGAVTPGLTWQGGLDFQWGNYRNDVNTLTLGARIEAFPKKLPILHNNALNKSIFSAFYINFAFGLGS